MKGKRAVIIIPVIGIILSVLVYLKEGRNNSEEAEQLIRNTSGEGDERIVLIAPSDMGEEEFVLNPEELEEEEELAKDFPESADGHAISWSYKKKKKAPLILGMTIVMTVMSYFLPKIEQEKKKQKHLKNMKEEYPNFAFRFSMLLSSGLTTRQVWERLLSHYEKSASKDIFCEEVRITCLELRNGISELKAYENLNKRCGIKEMTRFCGLLNQGVRRGSRELSERIREEARDALKMLSDELRRENETIGTKLLLPTTVLLLIVMVIVMLPAFSML